ncbi:MAG: YbaN family protein [Pseudomonadota bacterium]
MTRQHPTLRPVRWFWLATGWIALVLGMIGIPVPGLPTTPFILLAAYAFSKSSPRLASWLDHHNTFGPMIRNWREHGAIAPRYKVMSTVMMVACVGLSVVLTLPPVAIACQCIAMTGAGAYVLSRPNGPK